MLCQIKASSAFVEGRAGEYALRVTKRTSTIVILLWIQKTETLYRNHSDTYFYPSMSLASLEQENKLVFVPRERNPFNERIEYDQRRVKLIHDKLKSMKRYTSDKKNWFACAHFRHIKSKFFSKRWRRICQ